MTPLATRTISQIGLAGILSVIYRDDIAGIQEMLRERWIQASALVGLGFTPLAVAAYVPFLTFYAIFVHANVSWGLGPLGWLIASPKFHRWHHTSEDEGLDKNLAGLFPWLDLLFRTYNRRAAASPNGSASRTRPCLKASSVNWLIRSVAPNRSYPPSCLDLVAAFA